MDDPIAFFLTWSTYDTWLPGDARGWVEYRRGWRLPDPVRRLEAQAARRERACVLSPTERWIVERQIAETCIHRRWTLYAVNCRSNHLHIVVGAADTHPHAIRATIKAWCTRRLKESRPGRDRWWAERGSDRYVYDEETLDRAIQYVLEAQDRKHLDHGVTRSRPELQARQRRKEEPEL